VLRGGLGTRDISDENCCVTFQHHETLRSLREASVVVGCSICTALTNALESREDINVTEKTDIRLQAKIRYLMDQDRLRGDPGDHDIYRLDFTLGETQWGSHVKMEQGQSLLHTFALKPTSKFAS
jgi:hypothetical protein